MGSTISYYIYGTQDASGNRVEDASGNRVEDASGNRVEDASGCVLTRDASGNVSIHDVSGNTTEQSHVTSAPSIPVPIPVRPSPTDSARTVPPASDGLALSVSPLNSQNIHISKRHKGRKAH
jgi:hypothetical protein